MSSATVLAVTNGLKLVESAVEESGGPFLTGKDYRAIDLLLWPFFERFRPSAVMLPGTCFAVLNFFLMDVSDVCADRNSSQIALNQDFPVEDFPVLAAWMKEMTSVDDLQSAQLSHEIHVQLNHDLVEGKEVDYSLADTKEEGITIYASPRSH